MKKCGKYTEKPRSKSCGVLKSFELNYALTEEATTEEASATTEDATEEATDDATEEATIEEATEDATEDAATEEATALEEEAAPQATMDKARIAEAAISVSFFIIKSPKFLIKLMSLNISGTFTIIT